MLCCLYCQESQLPDTCPRNFGGKCLILYALHSVELLGRTWASSRLSVVLFCSACDRVMRTCLRSRGLFVLDHLNLLAPMFQQACITYWENHPPARELICSWWQSPDSVQIFIDRLKLGGVRVILWGQQKEFFPRGGSQTFLEDPEISWGSRSWRWSEVLRSERAVCPSPSGRHLCLERDRLPLGKEPQSCLSISRPRISHLPWGLDARPGWRGHTGLRARGSDCILVALPYGLGPFPCCSGVQEAGGGGRSWHLVPRGDGGLGRREALDPAEPGLCV